VHISRTLIVGFLNSEVCMNVEWSRELRRGSRSGRNRSGTRTKSDHVTAFHGANPEQNPGDWQTKARIKATYGIELLGVEKTAIFREFLTTFIHLFKWTNITLHQINT